MHDKERLDLSFVVHDFVESIGYLSAITYVGQVFIVDGSGYHI